MDTRRRVCLCKSANEAPVLQWLRSIRYQTASEEAHSLRDFIESQLNQSIGVDDVMSRNWLQSLCPCLHRSLTDEQDQRLNLVAHQSSSSSSFTVLESVPTYEALHHPISTTTHDPSETIVDELISPVAEIVVKTRKRHRPRHPTLPRISETADICQVVEEDLKFARQTWIHFSSECFDILGFCYVPSTVDRRSRIYSELCGVDEASPLEDAATSYCWQHHRSQQWLSQSSVFLSVKTDDKREEEGEKNPVGRVLLHSSQSRTLEPQRVFTCANASEAFFWNDALVLPNRLSRPNDLAQVS
jgi:hypothetical protein